ncbi:hypothetical protein ACFL4Y_03560 [Gemmatimonadota bacterium]
MAQTRMALICATALVGVVVCGATSSSQEPIRVTHEGSADLTGDGQPEHVRVTAVGARWDSLLVRLEIWDSRRQRLFYADEWSSKDWCGGPSYAVRDGTTEDWVRFELERHADPEFFCPGASRASRFGIGNRERPSAELIIDLYEQLWRAP